MSNEEAFSFEPSDLLINRYHPCCAESRKTKDVVGNISDSMCCLKHMMPGGDKECTLKCVSGGSKFVLADTAHKKVYQLSDQGKPKEFAGQKVKVTGTLSGETIQVSTIEGTQ